MLLLRCLYPIDRWTAAFHNFAQIEEEETRKRTGSVSKSAEPGASHEDRLVSDRAAQELVRLIAQMTPVRHVLLYSRRPDLH